MIIIVTEILHSKDLQSEESIDELKNKIIFGDCLEVMRKFPSESVDLIVTSPPYNLKNSTGNGMKDGRGGKWENAALKEGYLKHTDDMPYSEYCEWQRTCLNEMMRVLKKDGAIFYNHKWRVQKGLLQDRSDILKDFPVRQIIIWKRKGGINFNAGYFLPTYEVVYMIAKSDFKLKKGANRWGDVWEITQEMKNPHPAPYPLELANRIISSTNAQLVLDPFSGSGTTAVAAMDNECDFVCIDNSLEYCELARLRIEGGNWNGNR